jgi:hypothetical protein
MLISAFTLVLTFYSDSWISHFPGLIINLINNLLYKYSVCGTMSELSPVGDFNEVVFYLHSGPQP